MLTIILTGFFGLIIGSFLNVLILRTGVRALDGRSACMSCGATLRWYDLIPVFSWIYLRGRCRSCGSRISPQYPLVEATTALLFAALAGSALVYTPVLFAISLTCTALLIAIAVYDMRHTIIPDSWAYAFAVLSLVYAIVETSPGLINIYAVLAGPVAALPIATLWLVSQGRWIGLGDAKLSLGIGWLLGPVYGIGAVFFAFVVGALISVGVLMPLPHVRAMLGRWGIARFQGGGAHLTMKSEVPFGPFLVASCFIVWFALLYNLPLPW